MPRFRIIGATIGMMLASLVAVPAVPSPDADPQVDGLSILEDSATRLSGEYSDTANVATFTARQTSPTETTVELVVNGITISAVRDIEARTAVWGASGAALKPEDLATALGLYEAALEERWDEAVLPGRSFDGNRDLTLRLAMLVAEAPAGLPLVNQTISRPEERVLEDEATTSPPASSIGAAHLDSGACHAEVLATTEDKSGERRMGLAACQVANDNGISYFACTKLLRYLNHDANSHCFMSESIWTGPGSSNCMGECGPGCNGLNFYTQDCGDHDRCGRVHGGSTNPWDSECGDEYWDADDDFLLGWPQC